ncbi:hypothetical protein SESBI_35632 [Sesbania bispinosa]|nr:hypothetical protein SESBI_35632 [Sesbania bispinosa]
MTHEEPQHSHPKEEGNNLDMDHRYDFLTTTVTCSPPRPTEPPALLATATKKKKESKPFQI